MRRVLTVAVVSALATIGLSTPASASPEFMASHADAGTFYAGSVLTAAVTSPAEAANIRAHGGAAKVVTHTLTQLNGVVSNVDPHIAGTAWSVDVANNQVIVDVDASVTGAKLDAVKAAVAKTNGAARIEQTAGLITYKLSGGDAIFGGNFRCSLGFNVRNSAGTFFFLTAGHCTNSASQWFTNSSHTTLIGNRTGTSFPGNDYGIVQYVSSFTNHPGTVGSQDITSSGNASVGQTVTRRGSTTGIHSGTVNAVNATVNYPQGTVTGLIRTSVCAEPGDSGGSLYRGAVALGLTSGGSGNCSSGGTTFFQPVTEVLNVFGVSVY